MAVAAKRQRGTGPGPKKKRAKKSPTEGQEGKDPASVANAGAEEHQVPPPVSQGKWKNKERVLIFSSRGINFRTRHLMKDLRTLMPHSKADTKMDRKDKLFVINEVIYFNSAFILKALT
ncbi:ribosome biogenesis protein BRX1 homolog [Sphaerodactylus townsendi]|uniref:Ribosome biogenesis protein BRX1 n=1 Tax=Sphaerodactylus townsendi TaxID=933632 RepID=A0ACB8EP31_9SAUR|nr:ribosome biogenesis protein BRX1 homolog [Sphaerodactylus townsendi]